MGNIHHFPFSEARISYSRGRVVSLEGGRLQLLPCISRASEVGLGQCCSNRGLRPTWWLKT